MQRCMLPTSTVKLGQPRLAAPRLHNKFALHKPTRALRNHKQRSALNVRNDRSADLLKEQNRKYRRVVFDFEKWTHHRSTDRFTESIFTIISRRSRILRSLLKPIAWVTFVSTAVCTFNTAVQNGLLPSNIPQVVAALNPTVITLTSFALSLLLVFRTNSCYGRFDEARKMIGGTLNRCRDIARQATTGFPEGYDEHKAAVCRWLVAYVRAYRVHLQNEGDLRSDLKDILPPQELQLLMDATHRPVRALQMLSAIVNKVRLDTSVSLQIGQNLTFFHDQLGASERILRTPIPLSYTRHAERFMLTWLTLLPFCLYTAYGWATVPICSLVAVLLLAIDEIAIEIEEPFGILPLQAIGDVIQRDVMNQLKDGPTVLAAVKAVGLDAAASPASHNGVSMQPASLYN